MDILFICSDALGSSIITNLALAMEAKKNGMDVAVLFTGEALAAAVEGVFRWPQELTGQEMRHRMVDNAAETGIPVTGGRSEARRIDTYASLAQARKSGVTMLASPLWVTLLGLSGNLPEGIGEVSQAEELKMLREAKRIVGAF